MEINQIILDFPPLYHKQTHKPFVLKIGTAYRTYYLMYTIVYTVRCSIAC